VHAQLKPLRAARHRSAWHPGSESSAGFFARPSSARQNVEHGKNRTRDLLPLDSVTRGGDLPLDHAPLIAHSDHDRRSCVDRRIVRAAHACRSVQRRTLAFVSRRNGTWPPPLDRRAKSSVTLSSWRQSCAAAFPPADAAAVSARAAHEQPFLHN
jgi:hypothetical protein